MTERIEAGKVGELDGGDVKAVDAGERTVLLSNVDGELFAIDDECTHEACPLSEGYLDGDILECSCHGSMFNVRTGEVVEGPAEQAVPTYSVEVEDDTVYISVG